MNNTTNSKQPPPDPPPPSAPTATNESDLQPSSPRSASSDKADAAAAGEEEEDVVMTDKDPPVAAAPNSTDDSVDEDSATPATVFHIKLKQPKSNLLHKMSVPELCRTFSVVAWCGKLNCIACASETCARIPRSCHNIFHLLSMHLSRTTYVFKDTFFTCWFIKMQFFLLSIS